MRCFLAAFAAILLAGCAATGVQVKEEQLAEFEKGKTTIQDVIAKLGQPTRNTLLPDGSRTLTYTYVQAQARPENFIPIIGPLVGGHDVRSNIVMLRFSPNGVLRSMIASSSQRGTGRGAAAGAPMERVEDQPKQAP